MYHNSGEVMRSSGVNGYGSDSSGQVGKVVDFSGRFVRDDGIRQNGDSRTDEVSHSVHVDDAIAEPTDRLPSLHSDPLADLASGESVFEYLIVPNHATLPRSESGEFSVNVHVHKMPQTVDHF